MDTRPVVAIVVVAMLATLLAVPGAVASEQRPAGSAIEALAADAATAKMEGDRTADSWLVTFDHDHPASRVAAAAAAAEVLGGDVVRRWGHAVVGFQLDASAVVAERLSRLPGVALVESNDPVTASVVESPATWGLDRIDQRGLPLDDYYEVDEDGAHVRVYIIDSGIRPDHVEFGNRVLVAEGGTSVDDGFGSDDCNGHGTHVAGTVGGATYGVAQQVSLVPMRVLDCEGRGSDAGIISALDNLADNAILPAVANLSLGGPASSTVDAATQRVIDAGVTVVTAAGNFGGDACQGSPGRMQEVINVGATRVDDSFATYSDRGSCVDILAPGTDITSAWPTSTTDSVTLEGTSMAAPHVTGVAALALAADPTASPAEVMQLVTGTATSGEVTGVPPGTPNLLLHAARDASDTADGSNPDGSNGGGSDDPDVAPSPDGCDAYEFTFGGRLNAGDGMLLPPTQDYRTNEQLVHDGCLDGPSGADFDLALARYNASTGEYDLLATSESTAPDEYISTRADAGQYAWVVYAYSGSGDFQLGFTLSTDTDDGTPPPDDGGDAGTTPSPDGHELFDDVDADNVFTGSIGRLADAGVTRGCNPPDNTRFCPTDPVTRGQMAAFLTRALDLPADTTNRFTDDDTSVFEADIQALAAARITAGCNPPDNTRFCPTDPVTRGQMAAFLTRALDLPADTTNRFTDDDTSVFEADIQALAAARITAGCNPPDNTRFCPTDPVTREQMAAFLDRADLLD